MEAQRYTQTVIYLTLSEQEARWLMELVQNPRQDTGEMDRYRQLFNTLKQALDG